MGSLKAGKSGSLLRQGCLFFYFIGEIEMGMSERQEEKRRTVLLVVVALLLIASATICLYIGSCRDIVASLLSLYAGVVVGWVSVAILEHQRS
jgi:hypothetical protein